MKILLCTKHDLIGNMMLNLILPTIGADHTVEVLLANRQRPETALIPELGWMKLFEQDMPGKLLFPLLDKDPGLDGHWASFQALARRHDVKITNAGLRPRWPELTDQVRAAAPDIVVSFQFGFIFKPAALEAIRMGALNLHSGALPARAGVNPTFWCMKDGDANAACTLHWIDQGIDSGDLIEVRPMTIDYKKSFFANWIANYQNGAELISDALKKLCCGQPLPAIKQNAMERQYVPTPTQDDFKVFFERGRRLIDPEDYLNILDKYLSKRT